jgi:diadenosine tetraphosphate (Ap4A) HIT family hydrolase
MCVFCEIQAGQAPASFVHQDERVTAFMDIHPVNPGHVLVVPIRHVANLVDLDPQDGARMFQVAQQLSGALFTSGLRCEGTNLFLANGAVAGQEVFHVHLHVIPRFDGDGFGLRFSADYGQPVSRRTLDEAAERIRFALAGQ